MPALGDLTLAIELSNPGPPSAEGSGCGVALGRLRLDRAPEVIGTEAIIGSGPKVEGLHRVLERLCDRAGILPGEIGRVAVSLGPGGFTGLRISVMTAKLLAESTGAACVGVPTTDALRRRVDDEPGRCGPVVIGLAWKRADLWCAEYEAQATEPVSPPGIVSRDEALGRARGGVLVVDEALQEAWRQDGCIPADLTLVTPRFDPVAVLEVAADLEPIDPVRLAPIYPRPPEAVKRWRERK